MKTRNNNVSQNIRMDNRMRKFNSFPTYTHNTLAPSKITYHGKPSTLLNRIQRREQFLFMFLLNSIQNRHKISRTIFPSHQRPYSFAYNNININFMKNASDTLFRTRSLGFNTRKCDGIVRTIYFNPLFRRRPRRPRKKHRKKHHSRKVHGRKSRGKRIIEWGMSTVKSRKIWQLLTKITYPYNLIVRYVNSKRKLRRKRICVLNTIRMNFLKRVRGIMQASKVSTLNDNLLNVTDKPHIEDTNNNEDESKNEKEIKSLDDNVIKQTDADTKDDSKKVNKKNDKEKIKATRSKSSRHKISQFHAFFSNRWKKVKRSIVSRTNNSKKPKIGISKEKINHKRRKKLVENISSGEIKPKDSNKNTRNYRISAYLADRDWMKGDCKKLTKFQNLNISSRATRSPSCLIAPPNRNKIIGMVQITNMEFQMRADQKAVLKDEKFHSDSSYKSAYRRTAKRALERFRHKVNNILTSSTSSYVQKMLVPKKITEIPAAQRDSSFYLNKRSIPTPFQEELLITKVSEMTDDGVFIRKTDYLEESLPQTTTVETDSLQPDSISNENKGNIDVIKDAPKSNVTEINNVLAITNSSEQTGLNVIEARRCKCEPYEDIQRKWAQMKKEPPASTDKQPERWSSRTPDLNRVKTVQRGQISSDNQTTAAQASSEAPKPSKKGNLDKLYHADTKSVEKNRLADTKTRNNYCCSTKTSIPEVKRRPRCCNKRVSAREERPRAKCCRQASKDCSTTVSQDVAMSLERAKETAETKVKALEKIKEIQRHIDRERQIGREIEIEHQKQLAKQKQIEKELAYELRKHKETLACRTRAMDDYADINCGTDCIDIDQYSTRNVCAQTNTATGISATKELVPLAFTYTSRLEPAVGIQIPKDKSVLTMPAPTRNYCPCSTSMNPEYVQYDPYLMNYDVTQMQDHYVTAETNTVDECTPIFGNRTNIVDKCISVEPDDCPDIIKYPKGCPKHMHDKYVSSALIEKLPRYGSVDAHKSIFTRNIKQVNRNDKSVQHKFATGVGKRGYGTTYNKYEGFEELQDKYGINYDSRGIDRYEGKCADPYEKTYNERSRPREKHRDERRPTIEKKKTTYEKPLNAETQYEPQMEARPTILKVDVGIQDFCFMLDKYTQDGGMDGYSNVCPGAYRPPLPPPPPPPPPPRRAVCCPCNEVKVTCACLEETVECMCKRVEDEVVICECNKMKKPKKKKKKPEKKIVKKVEKVKCSCATQSSPKPCYKQKSFWEPLRALVPGQGRSHHPCPQAPCGSCMPRYPPPCPKPPCPPSTCPPPPPKNKKPRPPKSYCQPPPSCFPQPPHCYPHPTCFPPQSSPSQFNLMSPIQYQQSPHSSEPRLVSYVDQKTLPSKQCDASVSTSPHYPPPLQQSVQCSPRPSHIQIATITPKSTPRSTTPPSRSTPRYRHQSSTPMEQQYSPQTSYHRPAHACRVQPLYKSPPPSVFIAPRQCASPCAQVRLYSTIPTKERRKCCNGTDLVKILMHNEAATSTIQHGRTRFPLAKSMGSSVSDELIHYIDESSILAVLSPAVEDTPQSEEAVHPRDSLTLLKHQVAAQGLITRDLENTSSTPALPKLLQMAISLNPKTALPRLQHLSPLTTSSTSLVKASLACIKHSATKLNANTADAPINFEAHTKHLKCLHATGDKNNLSGQFQKSTHCNYNWHKIDKKIKAETKDYSARRRKLSLESSLAARERNDVLSPSRYLLESQKYYNELFAFSLRPPGWECAYYHVPNPTDKDKTRSIGSRRNHQRRTKRLDNCYTPRSRMYSPRKRHTDSTRTSESRSIRRKPNYCKLCNRFNTKLNCVKRQN